MSSQDGQILPADLSRWLEEKAQRLDVSSDSAVDVLPTLAKADLFRIGVPAQLGGAGGHITDAVRAVAAVSASSLTAGFVFWGHRTFIEYLLQSPNAELREKLLPDLLSGQRAGATGLSNAMKFLGGLEELQIKASPAGGSLLIDGKLPWVTNLPKSGFDVAAAVEGYGNRPAFIVSLSSDDTGVNRSNDLDLMGLRGSNTAAIAIEGARIGEDRIIHPDAKTWLPQVRPAFVALQCGMSIGLARRALSEARSQLGNKRGVLTGPVDRLTAELEDIETQLLSPLTGSLFVREPVQLFRLRIRLADIVTQAIQLELGTSGGKAYLSAPGEGFQRRLRESAFIPVVTPSLVQLKTALEAHEQKLNASEPA